MNKNVLIFFFLFQITYIGNIIQMAHDLLGNFNIQTCKAILKVGVSIEN